MQHMHRKLPSVCLLGPDDNHIHPVGEARFLPMEQILRCPNPDCRGTDLEYSEPDGATICMACHTIVEENAIVSSVEFNENNAGGASTVVGQFVGPEMTKAYSSAGRGRRRFYTRDSRDTTLNNGRRAIQQVVSQLRLRQAFVDRACRLFRTAVERNFVQGRKTMCVVAVCLYMVCREDNSPHMLIDFSDAVQINVYVLGHAFLKFKQLTGLNLAVIDPSIYIHRFAARLELGSEQEQTQVSQLALRLVASMQRDWIQAGRRPSGICGAALYLSAVYHEKPRTYKDVGRIVRVSPDTIKKRVDEFERTPISGMMSREELAEMAISDFEDLTRRQGPGSYLGEADPPSFTRALKMKEAQALQEGKKDFEERNGPGAKEQERLATLKDSSTPSGPGTVSAAAAAVAAVAAAAATIGSKRGGLCRGRGRGASVATIRSSKRVRRSEPLEEIAQEEDPLPQEEDEDEEGGVGDFDGGLHKELMDQLLDEEEEKAKKIAVAEAAAAGCQAPGRQQHGGKKGGEIALSESGVEALIGDGVLQDEAKETDDTAQYIRSNAEVEKLSKVWHEVHKGYLEKQARKKAEEEAVKKRAEEDFNYRPPGQSNQRRKAAAAAAAASVVSGAQQGAGEGGAITPAGPERSPAEIAVSNHLAKKRISKKINYEAVKMLGNDDDLDAHPPELEAMMSQHQA
ncbi:transcription factor iiib 90 kda subunit [Nannochloropsis gaditana]|uniref:B-related factor 1 n=1 Tax=Nannochloropsis gaditana TaxID=72520 RepID=W7TP75_9STRA|nr:transcription factor iiib 90 kda subunit [Nannochloropsis gaditana]